MLVQGNLDKRRSRVGDKDVALLVVGELEEFLAQVIAERILDMLS